MQSGRYRISRKSVAGLYGAELLIIKRAGPRFSWEYLWVSARDPKVMNCCVTCGVSGMRGNHTVENTSAGSVRVGIGLQRRRWITVFDVSPLEEMRPDWSPLTWGRSTHRTPKGSVLNPSSVGLNWRWFLIQLSRQVKSSYSNDDD